MTLICGPIKVRPKIETKRHILRGVDNPYLIIYKRFVQIKVLAQNLHNYRL